MKPRRGRNGHFVLDLLAERAEEAYNLEENPVVVAEQIWSISPHAEYEGPEAAQEEQALTVAETEELLVQIREGAARQRQLQFWEVYVDQGSLGEVAGKASSRCSCISV